jgi:hypothetical protein
MTGFTRRFDAQTNRQKPECRYLFENAGLRIVGIPLVNAASERKNYLSRERIAGKPDFQGSTALPECLGFVS